MAIKAESTNESVYGVKGNSIVAGHTDVVKGVLIDYMHSVLEGVTKSMVSYWFDSKYSRWSFSLKHKLKLVDRKLLSIKPPHEFRRSPRSIAKFWKASEYRAWLLFYSLPIVGPHLPAEYTHHYSLLVYPMLGSEISPDQLDIAEKLLKCFYQHMPDLYGAESCKMNTHSLITFVRMWGPLWVYSCFGFENMNGHLKKMFRGTRQILGQLVFTVKAQQALAFQYNFLSNESHVTMNFIDQYVRHQKQSPGHIFLGRRKKKCLLSSMYEAIKEYTGLNMSNSFQTTEYLQKDGVLFRINQEGYARCSSFCTIEGLSGKWG